ncbi:hypothetical protein H1230_01470 [Paenibacillus sp. 19GGS1-52]|uniref:hypothetical protein n=1 Tax=Paenibacillus sp. 19GGS1-52 TaxID=2758563 RepID=UPI001EFC1BFC|nr:hypothetical protein [Paenibacillus sp. 19GGS1-52]ULO07581.1 hypothetical protein H1230_01470 [Paenibacillus sp. 19GGS1-52]
MNNKKRSRVLLLLLVMATMLSACNGVRSGNNSYNLRLSKTVADEPQVGGIVTYGYSSPFKGLFEPAFYEGDEGLSIILCKLF